MGETYDQVDKEINRVAYKVVRGENNTPRVEIGDRKYSPGNLCHDSSENEKTNRRLFRTRGI